MTTKKQGGVMAMLGALSGMAGASLIGIWDTGPAKVEKRIENYSDGDDGDWTPELQAFLDDPDKPRKLVIGPGIFTLSDGIDICRTVVIEGQGAGTQLEISSQKTAFRIRHKTFCDSVSHGANGKQTVLRNLVLKATGALPDGFESFGVLLEQRATLDSILIDGFANGVRVDADVTRPSPDTSNANLWQLYDVTVQNAAHAGFIARGGDSNAGLGVMVSAVHNCSNHTTYPVTTDWPECAGIIDASFLGNTFVQPHTSDSNGQAGYRFEGASQRSVCLGCYRESNQPDGVLSQKSVAFGGLSGWGGGGVSISNNKMRNITLLTPTIAPKSQPSDPTPAIMFWEKGDGSLAHIEQENTNNFRGSNQGSNVQTGWRWNVPTNFTWTSGPF